MIIIVVGLEEEKSAIMLVIRFNQGNEREREPWLQDMPLENNWKTIHRVNEYMIHVKKKK